MSVSKRLRFEVLRRDNFTCRYCGAAAPAVQLHVDHVWPRSRGGADTKDNLVAACSACNLGKGDLAVQSVAGLDLSLAAHKARDQYRSVENSGAVLYCHGIWQIMAGPLRPTGSVPDGWKPVVSEIRAAGLYEDVARQAAMEAKDFSEFVSFCWEEIGMAF